MARNGQSSHGDSYCVTYNRAKRVDGRQRRGFSWGTEQQSKWSNSV